MPDPCSTGSALCQGGAARQCSRPPRMPVGEGLGAEEGGEPAPLPPPDPPPDFVPPLDPLGWTPVPEPEVDPPLEQPWPLCGTYVTWNCSVPAWLPPRSSVRVTS